MQNQKKLEVINKMLFEMAMGNLAFRLECYGDNGMLDEIASMLNDVAEKIQLVRTPQENEINQEPEKLPKPSQEEIIKNIHDYILANLEEPLPLLKKLAKQFGTNEFKLKKGFRHYFNTSVYQFYNDKRLDRAQQLIRQTPLPLKEVAYQSGFNSYFNFSKAFKKKYGYAPSVLRA